MNKMTTPNIRGYGISIIVRSLNEEKYIGLCLNSIYSQKINIPFEIILVDSESDDKTVLIARSLGCKIVDIKRSEFSYGKALNIGIAHASYSIIVSLSAHCIPISCYWLINLITPIITGEAEITFGAHTASDNARTSERNYFLFKYKIPAGICKKPLMNNGNSAFLYSVWLVKPFDQFLNAQEDLEFCKWHMQNNSKVRLFFINNALVTHHHNDNNKTLYRRIYAEFLSELQLNEKQFYDVLIAIVNCPLLIINDLMSAKKENVLFSAAKGIISFRIIQTFACVNAAIFFLTFL